MAAPARRTTHRQNFALRIAPFALIALVSAFVVTSQLRASPATTTGPDYYDLVLNLTFDNDSGSAVTDSSRYGHNGTATGTTVTDGKFGNGRSFNGTNNYIVVPHGDSLSPTSAMTVEAWMYLDTTNTAMKILQKRGVFTDTTGGYMLGAWFGNPRGYAFEAYDSNQHIVYPSPERSPATQTWTHVAATYDGNNLKLYENGQLQNSVAWSGAMTRSTKDLWIRHAAGQLAHAVQREDGRDPDLQPRALGRGGELLVPGEDLVQRIMSEFLSSSARGCLGEWALNPRGGYRGDMVGAGA